MDALALRAQFDRAGLVVRIAQQPLSDGRSAEPTEIVQIDIRPAPRRSGHHEQFLIWLGASSNRVEVLTVDRSLQQLILLVDEPARQFEVELPRWSRADVGQTIVRRQGKRRFIQQTTPGRKRHFLCGEDERHLFIAMLPSAASTVRGAHDRLRAPAVRRHERAGGRVSRQGEWFFLGGDHDVAAKVDALVTGDLSRYHGRLARKAGIAHAANIRRLGRPHLAEEIVVFPNAPGLPVPAGAYVRGWVRHPDHHTQKFLHWTRVVANLEAMDSAVEGVKWMD